MNEDLRYMHQNVQILSPDLIAYSVFKSHILCAFNIITRCMAHVDMYYGEII